MDNENELSKLIDQIYMINLPEDHERCDSTLNELNNNDFDTDKLTIITGVTPTHSRVKNMYKNGKVSKTHDKRLTPERIGNWLSHYDAWKSVSENKGNFSLIMEDDIKFVPKRMYLINQIKDRLSKIKSIDAPIYVKLADLNYYKGCGNKKPGLYHKSKIKGWVSNPMYIINKKFADKLINNLGIIKTVSDKYVSWHSRNVKNTYALIPNIVNERSMILKDVESRLRPKGGNMKRFDK